MKRKLSLLLAMIMLAVSITVVPVSALFETMDTAYNGTLYVDFQSSYFYMTETPNTISHFVKYTGVYGEQTFLLKSKNPSLRFKIYDANRLEIYDSNKDSTAHRTKFISSLTNDQFVEKRKRNITVGTVYVEVYIPENLRTSTSSTISGSYNLYVGEPPTLSNSVTYYSNSTVTGTSTAFSSSVIIPVPAADVPKTAKVTRVLLKSQTAGITLSKIHSWRTRRTGTSTWYNSGIFVNQIDIMNLG